MLPPHQADRVMLLHDALKEKAPRTYQDLKKKGQLWPFLVDREEQMMDAWSLAKQNVLNPWKRENRYLERQGQGLEFLQKHRQLINRLSEETLATFTEFSDPPEDDEEEW